MRIYICIYISFWILTHEIVAKVLLRDVITRELYLAGGCEVMFIKIWVRRLAQMFTSGQTVIVWKWYGNLSTTYHHRSCCPVNHHLNKQKYFSINIFAYTKFSAFGYFGWSFERNWFRQGLLESATHFFVCHLACWPSTIDAVDAAVALG